MAAVTGYPLERVRQAILETRDYRRTASGRYEKIAGLETEDLIGAMDLLGWRIAESGGAAYNKGQKVKLMTLAEFASRYGSGGPFIVSAGHHYQAISAGEFCDTFTTVPIPLDIALRPGKGRAGKWVDIWWRFAEIEAPPTA